MPAPPITSSAPPSASCRGASVKMAALSRCSMQYALCAVTPGAGSPLLYIACPGNTSVCSRCVLRRFTWAVTAAASDAARGGRSAQCKRRGSYAQSADTAYVISEGKSLAQAGSFRGAHREGVPQAARPEPPRFRWRPDCARSFSAALMQCTWGRQAQQRAPSQARHSTACDTCRNHTCLPHAQQLSAAFSSTHGRYTALPNSFPTADLSRRTVLRSCALSSCLSCRRSETKKVTLYPDTALHCSASASRRPQFFLLLLRHRLSRRL